MLHVEYTTTPEQRQVLLAQAEMIHRSSLASLPEPQDVADVKREYERLLRTARAL